jgi:hypothetical protein
MSGGIHEISEIASIPLLCSDRKLEGDEGGLLSLGSDGTVVWTPSTMAGFTIDC